VYDSDNGTILTRTPLSWLKITVFYIIYYAFLTGFWITCLLIFFETLPAADHGPKWLKDEGMIGNNPGVGLRPRSTDKRIDSQMFVLKEGDKSPFPSEPTGEGDLNADYAERVNQFFKVYDKRVSTQVVGRQHGYTAFSPKDSLGDCGVPPYGYVGEKVTPCIFIKLNNIWGWNPKPVECGNPNTKGTDGNPMDECSKGLLAHFANGTISGNHADSIFIDCNGRGAADKEALHGGLEYFPKTRAIPINGFFPYKGQGIDINGKEKTAYHPPLVAVRVTPKQPGQLIHIECRAYFRGVEHSKKHKLGLVQFEVQVI
jgi:sodium/potassium-transporting ATPase subunit beta